MSIATQTIENWPDYELIDTGGGEKLERFGTYVLARPEPQAIWRKALSELWFEKDAHFVRLTQDPDRGVWRSKSQNREQWAIQYLLRDKTLTFRLGMTNSKHIGLFPEQAINWEFIYQKSLSIPNCKVLNLFAYTGGATLAARAAGSDVTHLDSVRPVVSWASKNEALSGLSGSRWVVEDALKFVRRQVKRRAIYNGIILDPPAYGRGPNGERWILEDNLNELIELCSELLDPKNYFFVLNLYSMGLSALIGETLIKEHFNITPHCSELYLSDRNERKLPLGTCIRF